MQQRSLGKRNHTLGADRPLCYEPTPRGVPHDIALDATLGPPRPNCGSVSRVATGGWRCTPRTCAKRCEKPLRVRWFSRWMPVALWAPATAWLLLKGPSCPYCSMPIKARSGGHGEFSWPCRYGGVPPTGSVERAQQCLADMRTGTHALAAGLIAAQDMLVRYRQRERQTQLLVVLTDGRANAGIGPGDPVMEALQQAGGCALAGCHHWWWTPSRAPCSLAWRAAWQTCRGHILRLEELAASTLARAVRLSLAGWHNAPLSCASVNLPHPNRSPRLSRRRAPAYVRPSPARGRSIR